MDWIREAEEDLIGVFRTSVDKHAAHRSARRVLEQLSREPRFLTAVLDRYVRQPGTLDRTNYPVIGIDIAANPWFALVANCWIPLPARQTQLSTKCIHHHGPLLLSTVTAFGPGYEHWMFGTPKPVDAARDLYAMELLEVAPHPRHHVAFVDRWIAHTPFYPSSLSITLALWSNDRPVTWRDRVKHLPAVKNRAEFLREAVLRLGLRRVFDVKVVESYDYFPTDDGFKAMRERKEFVRGPVEDHVCSVFHVLQGTGNEHLGRTIRRSLATGKVTKAREKISELVDQLERGVPIEGSLSPGHYDLPYANFTGAQIQKALDASKAKIGTTNGGSYGGEFTAQARS